MINDVSINGRTIGPGHPAYIIAEMSGNHHQNFDRAVEMLHAMKDAGADAVKLQTYTADTITIQSDRPEFIIGKGTPWEGKTLYDFYSEAFTPWEWQPKLQKIANELGMGLFSSPFDPTAVDFLEETNIPAYKIASYELVDIPLIEKVATTGKPIIISTGMANFEDIQDALNAARNAGNNQIILLKCTCAYPTPPEEMNLNTIPDMQKQFDVLVGLSDHSLGIDAPVTAVKLGACVIEKHFCMSRSEPGPDRDFSLEPQEFKAMVDAIRAMESGSTEFRANEKVLGSVRYGPSKEEKCTPLRRSLYVVKDVSQGEEFTNENVRSIRPGNGMPPKELSNILRKRATEDIERGTPLRPNLIAS